MSVVDDLVCASSVVFSANKATNCLLSFNGADQWMWMDGAWSCDITFLMATEFKSEAELQHSTGWRERETEKERDMAINISLSLASSPSLQSLVSMVTISRLTAGNWCRRTGRQAGRGQTLIYSNTHKPAHTHAHTCLTSCLWLSASSLLVPTEYCLSFLYLHVSCTVSAECVLHAKWATAGHIICPSGNCTGTGFSVTAPASASLRDCVQTPSYVGGHQRENQKIFSP